MRGRKRKYIQKINSEDKNTLSKTPSFSTTQLEHQKKKTLDSTRRLIEKYWLHFFIPLTVTILAGIFLTYNDGCNKRAEIEAKKVYPKDLEKINIVIAQFGNNILPEENNEHNIDPALIYAKLKKELSENPELNETVEVIKLDKYTNVNLENFSEIAKARHVDILVFGSANEANDITSDREIFVYEPHLSKLNDLMVNCLSKAYDDSLYRYETLHSLPFKELIVLNNYNFLYYYIGLCYAYKNDYKNAVKYVKKARAEAIRKYEDIVISKDLVLLYSLNNEPDSARNEISRLLSGILNYQLTDSNISFYNNYINIGNLSHIIFNSYIPYAKSFTSFDLTHLYYFMISSYSRTNDRIGFLSAITHYYYIAKTCFRGGDPSADIYIKEGIAIYQRQFGGDTVSIPSATQFISDELKNLANSQKDTTVNTRSARSSLYQLKYAAANAILALPDETEYNNFRQNSFIAYNKVMAMYNDPDRFTRYESTLDKKEHIYKYSQVSTGRVYTMKTYK